MCSCGYTQHVGYQLFIPVCELRVQAIRDGGIDAVIDRNGGWMLSKETGDVYSTMEPQGAFHSRIAFCLNTHNEAVRVRP